MADSKTKKKLEDSKWSDVIVTYRDPNNDTPIVNIGGNHVIENGEMTIRHFKIKVGEKVTLPEPFIKDLENRSHVVKGPDGTVRKLPILDVQRV